MSQYASWIMEYEREKLGLDRKDESHDEEIIRNLQSGVKISKSVHMKTAEVMRIEEIELEELREDRKHERHRE